MEAEDGRVDGCTFDVKPGGVGRGADGAGAARDSSGRPTIEAGTVEAIAAFKGFTEGGSKGERTILGHAGAYEEVSAKLRLQLALRDGRCARAVHINGHYGTKTWSFE